MNSVLGSFKKRMSIVFALVLALGFSSVFGTPSAQAAQQDKHQYKREAERLAIALYEASNYDIENNRYSFDVDKAIAAGVTLSDAVQMKNYLESLSPAQAKDIHDQQMAAVKDGKNQPQVLPIILWAARVLAMAGLGWAAKKLLDMGGYEFCKRWKNYNSVTKYVCKFIG